MTLTKLFSAAAVAAMTVTGAAQAATLSGTFTVEVNSFEISGTKSQRRAMSGATEANLASNGGPLDTFTYTGLLDFRLGGGGTGSTTIDIWLSSGTGVVTGLDAAVGALQLSRPTFQRVSIFSFTSIFDHGLEGVITHDDGIQLFDDGQLVANRSAPTSVVNTDYEFSSGEFRLLYAAANGNPSVLEVTGEAVAPVPLPAPAMMLLAALAGLGFLGRKRGARA